MLVKTTDQFSLAKNCNRNSFCMKSSLMFCLHFCHLPIKEITLICFISSTHTAFYVVLCIVVIYLLNSFANLKLYDIIICLLIHFSIFHYMHFKCFFKTKMLHILLCILICIMFLLFSGSISSSVLSFSLLLSTLCSKQIKLLTGCVLIEQN